MDTVHPQHGTVEDNKVDSESPAPQLIKIEYDMSYSVHTLHYSTVNSKRDE